MFAEAWPGPLIAQNYVKELPASVAFIGGVPLRPCEQRLTADGRFAYLGGRTLPPALAARAVEIAGRAVRDLAGLTGYVGVDVLLGNDGRDWAVEINPRLTTSYVGLRAMTADNLMGAMLVTARGGRVSVTWEPGDWAFSAEGVVSPVSHRQSSLPPGAAFL